MSMNPHALESAPHSFISTVYAKPKAEAELLRKVARKFPNITAVRIKEAIAQVSSILSSISSVILYEPRGGVQRAEGDQGGQEAPPPPLPAAGARQAADWRLGAVGRGADGRAQERTREDLGTPEMKVKLRLN